MTKIDWTKPIELDDGTPLIASDTGETYHVDIRTVAGVRHSAFPSSTHGKGSARRDTGLVISNHKFRVRNISRRTIDLSFQTLDRVTCTEFPGEWQIEKIEGPYFTLKNRKGETAGNLQAHHLKFACHNHDAPFTTISCDHAEDFADGYQSGLAIGLTGDFYQAGGPGGVKLNKPGVTCRHYKEHDEIDAARSKSWREGWRKGQDDARTPKIDWTKPIEALGNNGKAVPAKVVRSTAPAAREVFVDGKSYEFNNLGGMIPRNFDWVIRNKGTLQRTGYGIFGQTHTSLFDTLEEVSAHWWKTRDPARGTKQLSGEFIVRLEQERDTGHDPWTTISTSGPIEPLPAPPVVDHVYQATGRGYVWGSVFTNEADARKTCAPVEGIAKVTRTDGKVTAVEFLP